MEPLQVTPLQELGQEVEEGDEERGHVFVDGGEADNVVLVEGVALGPLLFVVIAQDGQGQLEDREEEANAVHFMAPGTADGLVEWCCPHKKQD